MALRIEDYGLIGNTHTAALVGKNGSIDWLCLPQFDSGACFAGLLGTDDNGHWQIAPRDRYQVRRRYLDNTLVLQTEFETPRGKVALTDCMLMNQGHPVLVRLVEGLHGVVPMSMELVLRFDYGQEVPWVRKVPNVGLSAVAGPDSIRIHTNVPMRGENFKTLSDFSVGRGEKFFFVMSWHASHKEPSRDIHDPFKAVDETKKWWEQWAAKATYEGRWKHEVTRSIITLKSLTYTSTGGIVAAPTTSLPEDLGGVRNWDYRYCWLRDATFTLYSLMITGYVEEAQAWRKWLLRAVAGMPSQIGIMYGLKGERRLLETEIPWLGGYENSRPVRVGNAACKQFQLDVFGEVIEALHVARRFEEMNCDDEPTWNLEHALLDYLEGQWQNPDHGIWEIRGEPRHFVHSKVMAWVAMDRAIRDIEKYHLEGPLDQWKKVRRKIHDEICEKGFDRKKNSFVQYYGAEHLDASLLMMPLVGFLPVQDPRMTGTVAAVERELLHDGFVRRYLQEENSVDGISGTEGVFLSCSFWLVNNYLLQGRFHEGEEMLKRLLSLRNDLGLFSEEYDVKRRRLVGNFPQAFTHVSFVNCARNLSGAGGPLHHRLFQNHKKN